ncbi:MAG: type I restriction endonuclease, partial [Chloroflexota bacterium]|nr:type I restriction endonuclease [Chloroflexota bacterium]
MSTKPAKITESVVEETALAWFESLGYVTAFGPDLAFDGARPERKAKAQYSDVILEDRLLTALEDINPNIPADVIEDAVRKITRTENPSLIENNRRFHRLLTDGVDVSYMDKGREVFDKVWLLDLEDLENNDWLVVNQFTVVENRINRRPDLVVFVNGLPLAVVELKNPADEKATIRQAFNQFQTYKQDIPTLFTYNELLIVSDGLEARCGSITSGWDRFMPWRTVDGTEVAPKGSACLCVSARRQVELEVLIKGIFDKRRLLDLILNFIVFEDDGGVVVKKVAAYHQYHAVNKAVECTLSACGVDAEPGQLYADFPVHDELNPFGLGELIVPPYGKNSNHFGGRRIGVIWHT